MPLRLAGLLMARSWPAHGPLTAPYVTVLEHLPLRVKTDAIATYQHAALLEQGKSHVSRLAGWQTKPCQSLFCGLSPRNE